MAPHPDAEKWNERYREADGPAPEPARVLVDFAHLLPGRGNVLELACGLGRNALWLAARGLTVEAWDISRVAIDRLRQAAKGQGLALHTEVRDVASNPPPARGYDVVVVARFLDRSLAPAIAACLRPGGLLFYQTFTRERVSDRGPKDPAYRLERNELLRLFPSLTVLAYREEGVVGDTHRGFRDEAMLVGQRPADA